MITFKSNTRGEQVVYLDGKKVGTIKRCGNGWAYYPKSGATWCEGMGRWEREDDLRAEFAGESAPDNAEEGEE